ncbi:hypothetical protein C7S13_2909 [Burkholderia cepacia]|nr:hypothetical protein [Burkholderia cepacia]MDW9243109.1 hypothetical protein [Burkholderia cepacia]
MHFARRQSYAAHASKAITRDYMIEAAIKGRRKRRFHVEIVGNFVLVRARCMTERCRIGKIVTYRESNNKKNN